MKRFGLLFLLVVLCVVNSQAQAQKAVAAPLTVIRAGTLIDGHSETPRKNQLIFVRGNRIEKIADGSAAIPHFWNSYRIRCLSARGRTVLEARGSVGGVLPDYQFLAPQFFADRIPRDSGAVLLDLGIIFAARRDPPRAQDQPARVRLRFPRSNGKRAPRSLHFLRP